MTFLLVHGAWHDGSAWDAVAGRLRSAGHRVHAPTLPGHGPGADRRVTHAEGVRALRELVEREGLERIVAVGHSLGGTFVAALAEALPGRIERLVFQSAFIPADGQSMLEQCPPEYRANFLRLARMSGDDTVSLPYFMWRELFVNDADEALARRTHALLSPQPCAPCREPVSLPRLFGLGLPATVIDCEADRALPQGAWGWARMWSRLGRPERLSLPGGHEVMFTDPDGLAARILQAAGRA